MSKKKKRFYNGNLPEGGFANMPSEVVMKEYPKIDGDNWSSDYDTPAGVDRQMMEDVSGAKKNKKHRKY